MRTPTTHNIRQKSAGGDPSSRGKSRRADRAVNVLGRFEEQAARFVLEQPADFRFVGDGRQKEVVNHVIGQTAQ
jgi:hypothetical protein